MRERSRTDMVDTMLRVASDGGGATKTKIMYGAYLSYAQLREYMDLLVETGLLARDDSTQLFRPTEKGRRFMRASEELRQLVGRWTTA